MSYFIFITDEGYTQTPQKDEIENLQVVGFAEGANAEEAFSNLKIENKELKETGFCEIIAMELKGQNQNYLSLWDN